MFGTDPSCAAPYLGHHLCHPHTMRAFIACGSSVASLPVTCSPPPSLRQRLTRRAAADMENRGYVSKNVFLKFLEVFSPVLPAQLPQFPTSWTVAEVRPTHTAPLPLALAHPPAP